MVTKYVLHGGMAHEINSQNDLFFQEILKDTSDNLIVLLVYFSKEVDRIPKNKAEDISQFNKNKKSKKITFKIADELTFTKQVSESDIVFFHGGNTLKLLETLKKFKNLKKLLNGKIVAGESAGAYVLSSFFYSKTIGKSLKGIGLVPVKTICHYIGQNRDKLKEAPKNLKPLLLGEYKFKVFRI